MDQHNGKEQDFNLWRSDRVEMEVWFPFKYLAWTEKRLKGKRDRVSMVWNVTQVITLDLMKPVCLDKYPFH